MVTGRVRSSAVRSKRFFFEFPSACLYAIDDDHRILFKFDRVELALFRIGNGCGRAHFAVIRVELRHRRFGGLNFRTTKNTVKTPYRFADNRNRFLRFLKICSKTSDA